MDKKHKQHLLITLVFTLIVTATLFFMYDRFAFQTYGEVVYYDYILMGENEQLKAENIEVYLDSRQFYFGDGRIVFKDPNLTNGVAPNVTISLYGENEQKYDYHLLLEGYQSDNLIYSLPTVSNKYKEVKLDEVKSAALIIEANEQKVSEIDLKITPVEQLEGSNKEYRIENASVSDSMMRLGTLKSASDEIIKEYPTVSLEYRYLKDQNGDKKDNDNYVVFKKITGKSKDLVNRDDYGTYNLDDAEDSFKDKELSVVIIFSNEKDKFAFAIDLKTREVGDYYG